jgi:hypothetical protein
VLRWNVKVQHHHEGAVNIPFGCSPNLHERQQLR